MTWWWVLALTVPPGVADRCAGEVVLLDRARAMAYATGDPARLEAVYTAHSPLLTQDQATLAAYTARGGRVIAFVRVSRCREIARTARTKTVQVTDALGVAHVTWDDGSVDRLPDDRATRRVVTLRMTADGWRISGSRPAEPS